MITLFRNGTYKLIETKNYVKILSLDNEAFAWVVAQGIGEILVETHVPHQSDHILATGRYSIYDVENEPNLTDLQHLELEIGKDTWQGYLLLTGLPDDTKRRARIIPTTQLIVNNPRFIKRMGFLGWGAPTMGHPRSTVHVIEG